MLARVRIAPPSSSNTARSIQGASKRQVLARLLAGDQMSAHAGHSHRLEPALGGRAQPEDAVAGEQLGAEVLLPVPPHPAGFEREVDQAPVVVGVAEDPRLAARLGVARYAALVHGHIRALFS